MSAPLSRSRLAISILVCVALLSACSRGTTPTSRAGVGDGSTSGSPTTQASGVTGVKAGTSEAPSGKSGTSTAGATSPSPSGLPSGPASHNTMPLTVTMAACVQPGTDAEATATSSPGSKLAFAASYDDNNLPPDFTYVEGAGNPTGTFTWRWLVRPTTPVGNGLLTVVASKGDKGASYDFPFKVKKRC